jgi:hypothetical protein
MTVVMPGAGPRDTPLPEVKSPACASTSSYGAGGEPAIEADKNASAFAGLWQGWRRSNDEATILGRFLTLLDPAAAADMEPEEPIVDHGNSQDLFADISQTCIVFDWDDTLFPTTYVQDVLGLAIKVPLQEQRVEPGVLQEAARNLSLCAARTEELLRSASRLGKVVIVTLSRCPWVSEACANFLPEIGPLIEELGVPVVYAQEGLFAQDSLAPTPGLCQNWSEIKGKAIESQLKVFYSQYEGQSWKNVISIGDSNHERIGTHYAMNAYLERTGRKGAVRTKTVKLASRPTFTKLAEQLQMMRDCLPLVVRLDSGFDVDLSDVRDARTLRACLRSLASSPAQQGTRSLFQWY